MNQHFSQAILVLIVIVLGSLGLQPAAASNLPFADPAFAQVWQRTDALVASGKVQRGYYWGPTPSSGPLQEAYAEGKDGKRTVQYFDKSRMEINNPNADKNSKFYVTNGLLTRELVSGQMQVGNNAFIARDPAQIPLASDLDDHAAPTYASFAAVVNKPEGKLLGNVVNATIAQSGSTSSDSDYERYNVLQAYYEPTTQHNIPDLFWNFLNQSGPITENNQLVKARLNDPWFYATGYPISAAYWAKAIIGGQANTPVLIQAFERRVLTYVPSALTDYKVQMSNIGQHYYQWRYGLPTAQLPPDPGVGCGEGVGGPNAGSVFLVWRDNITIRRQVGCPLNDIPSPPTTVVRHSFERGLMVSVQTKQSDPKAARYVYVLYNDGTVQWFDDRYVDGNSDPSLGSPPNGLITPHFGFGKVWRENATVQQRLGWATSYERKLEPGEYRFFERGLLYQSGPDINNVYALVGSNLQYASWSKQTVALYSTTCSAMIGGSFGKLWLSSGLVANQLSCPNIGSGSAKVSIQHFQGGHLIYVSLNEAPTHSSIGGTQVFYLFKDQSAYADFNFSHNEQPVAVNNPPAGLYAPGSSFSSQWASFGLLRERLGWATAPEQPLAEGDYQFFGKGLMLREGGKIYYFYSVRLYSYAYPSYWQVYNEPR